MLIGLFNIIWTLQLVKYLDTKEANKINKGLQPYLTKRIDSLHNPIRNPLMQNMHTILRRLTCEY